MPGPYDRRWFRGVQLDEITIAALEWAEAGWSKPGNVGEGKKIEATQGSYNAGGVEQSAGTHDGGGAVDIKTVNLTTVQRRRLVRWLRRAGFAAWFRPAMPPSGSFKGWGPHIHAILLEHPHASAGAKAQMTAYRNGRNGLANNAEDTTWRPDPIPVFNWAAKRPLDPGEKVLRRTAPAAKLTVTELRAAEAGKTATTGVHSLQVALRRQGKRYRALHPTAADGVYGAGTKAMVKLAQEQTGRKPTGMPQAALLADLGYNATATVAASKSKRKR